MTIKMDDLNSALFPHLNNTQYRQRLQAYIAEDPILKMVKSYNENSFRLPPKNISWVSREEWGAKPGRITPPLENRRSYVFYTSTRSITCWAKESCKRVIARKQDIQMNEQSSPKADIIYNFMIGGDGNIYEGRGWKNRPELPRNYKQLSPQSILIAFVGRYRYDQPSSEMFEAANGIIRKGLQMLYLKPKLLEFILPP